MKTESARGSRDAKKFKNGVKEMMRLLGAYISMSGDV